MRARARWLAFRIAVLPLIFLAVSFVSFWLIFEATAYEPGGGLGDYGRGDRERIRQALDLDEPWLYRYAWWLRDAAQGDLGTDRFTNKPITTTIGDRLPESAELLAIAFVVAVAVGMAISYGANRRDWIATSSLLLSAAFGAIPVFVSGHAPARIAV